jgi:hypothetical protein
MATRLTGPILKPKRARLEVIVGSDPTEEA